MAGRHCADGAQRGDEQQIQRACDELKSYGGVIGSRHFGQAVPSDALLYVRTARVCVRNPILQSPTNLAHIEAMHRHQMGSDES